MYNLFAKKIGAIKILGTAHRKLPLTNSKFYSKILTKQNYYGEVVIEAPAEAQLTHGVAVLLVC